MEGILQILLIKGSSVLGRRDRVFWSLIGLACAAIGGSRLGIDLHEIWAGFMRRWDDQILFWGAWRKRVSPFTKKETGVKFLIRQKTAGWRYFSFQNHRIPQNQTRWSIPYFINFRNWSIMIKYFKKTELPNGALASHYLHPFEDMSIKVLKRRQRKYFCKGSPFTFLKVTLF
jgi:hypothetical protein